MFFLPAPRFYDLRFLCLLSALLQPVKDYFYEAKLFQKHTKLECNER